MLLTSRRRSATVAAVVVAALLLFGCGGSSPETQGVGGGDSASSSASTSTSSSASTTSGSSTTPDFEALCAASCSTSPQAACNLDPEQCASRCVSDHETLGVAACDAEDAAALECRSQPSAWECDAGTLREGEACIEASYEHARCVTLQKNPGIATSDFPADCAAKAECVLVESEDPSDEILCVGGQQVACCSGVEPVGACSASSASSGIVSWCCKAR